MRPQKKQQKMEDISIEQSQRIERQPSINTVQQKITIKRGYRQKLKQLYDQDCELTIKHYYRNTRGSCEMMKYYETLRQQYNVLKDKKVSKLEEYRNQLQSFINAVSEKIRYFHAHQMCKEYVTKEQYFKNKPVLEFKNGWPVYKVKEKQESPFSHLIELDNQFQGGTIYCQGETNYSYGSSSFKKEKTNKGINNTMTYATCIFCPIYIEEFEHNFKKIAQTVAKTTDHWDQLSGGQRMSKYRSHFSQNLNVLRHMFENKCQYSYLSGKYKSKSWVPKTNRNT